MANISLSPPLFPKNQHTLVVLGVCRISTEHQSLQSLEAQEALLRQWVSERYDGQVEFVVVAGRGSGELIDRDEAYQILKHVETRRYDLVIAEDLGRIYRRIHALSFCEECEDAATRVVAINDHLDTGDGGWKLSGYFAVMRHEQYNVDTSRRIRRSLRDSFQKGGICQTFSYGYLKPPGAKHDSEIQKDPQAEAVFEKWFQILEGGGTYSEVADWLNAQNVPLGKYTRRKRWDCGMVGRITRNPILKGVRCRNRKVTFRVNKTGRHQQRNGTPEDLLQRNCPHLAFIEAERYDRLIRMLTVRNAQYRRRRIDGKDPRANVPKKRTRWPGQHLYCGCCGGMMFYGAHGQTHRLMCSNAKEYRCWMSMSVDGLKARDKLCFAILELFQQLPEFESELLSAIRAEAEIQTSRNLERRVSLSQELTRLEAAVARITAAVSEYGASNSLMQELRNLEQRQLELRADQDNLASSSNVSIRLPSVAETRERVGEAFRNVMTHDAEAARLLRAIISKIEVWPYRSIDGGHPVLRARFTVNFAALEPTLGKLVSSGHPWVKTLEIDLFDPVQRFRIREEVIALRAAGMTSERIAAQLKVTKPVIVQAVNLQKRMDEMGITDPYQPITSPPPDYIKLRRYKHIRFQTLSEPEENAA